MRELLKLFGPKLLELLSGPNLDLQMLRLFGNLKRKGQQLGVLKNEGLGTFIKRPTPIERLTRHLPPGDMEEYFRQHYRDEDPFWRHMAAEDERRATTLGSRMQNSPPIVSHRGPADIDPTNIPAPPSAMRPPPYDDPVQRTQLQDFLERLISEEDWNAEDLR